MDTLLSITALVVSVALGLPSLYFAWRSTKASMASANASKDSATASEESAKAARESLSLEREREYDRLRPKLYGRLVPESGGPEPINAWLEVHLDPSTPLRLSSMRLTVPADAHFARGRGQMPVRMANDFGYPEEGRRREPIRVGHPARWRVYRGPDARGTVVGTAVVRLEDGTLYEDLAVEINQDFGEGTQSGNQ